MKQYLDASLPMEIVEAARIDGAGEFYTFNHIVLPIMKPALAVQAIFSFVSSWNNYFIPALVLDTADKKTLAHSSLHSSAVPTSSSSIWARSICWWPLPSCP